MSVAKTTGLAACGHKGDTVFGEHLLEPSRVPFLRAKKGWNLRSAPRQQWLACHARPIAGSRRMGRRGLHRNRIARSAPTGRATGERCVAARRSVGAERAIGSLQTGTITGNGAPHLTGDAWLAPLAYAKARALSTLGWQRSADLWVPRSQRASHPPDRPCTPRRWLVGSILWLG